VKEYPPVDALLIIMEKTWSAVPKLFVARKVKLYVPATVGVPVMLPRSALMLFNESPVGSEPETTV